MATYRFLSYTLVPPITAVAEIPFTEVTYTRALNDCGTLNLKLPMSAGLGFDAIDATQPNQRAIYVERDGVLVGGYIIRTRSWDAAGQALTLGGSGFLKFYEGRLTGTVSQQTNVDPVALARTIFSNAEAQGNSIGLTIGTETSSALVSMGYVNWKESKSVIEYVNNLSKAGAPVSSGVQIGFDYAIDVAWDGGVPVRTLAIGWPRRGRVAGATGIVFDTASKSINYTYPEDGGSQANYIQCIGQGSGAQTTSATGAITSVAASTTGVGASGYPMIQKSVTGLKDVADQTLMDARAQSELALKATPVIAPTLTIRGELEPPIGSFIEGDDARVIFGPDLRFPTALDTYMRIISFSVSLSGPGTEERTTVVLNEIH